MALDELQLACFKDRLEEDLAAIRNEWSAAQAGAATVALDQTSVGRLSRMDALQQQAMSAGLRERLTWRRKRTGAALERLLTEEFGICCVCGEDMTYERLQADPSAPFCAECQQNIDIRRKAR